MLDELIDAGGQVIAVHHQRGLGASSERGGGAARTGNSSPCAMERPCGSRPTATRRRPAQWLGSGSKAMSEGNVESLRQTVDAFKQGDRTTRPYSGNFERPRRPSAALLLVAFREVPKGF